MRGNHGITCTVRWALRARNGRVTGVQRVPPGVLMGVRGTNTAHLPTGRLPAYVQPLLVRASIRTAGNCKLKVLIMDGG